MKNLKETQVPQGDIKSFITKEEETDEVPSETKPEDITPSSKPEEVLTQPWQNNKADNKSDTIEEESNANTQESESSNNPIIEKSEYEIENERIALEEKKDKIYDNENVISINFFDSIKICF